MLRVLEIGAGTGGTTATVLSSLDARTTEYTFTDVSDFFLQRAAERFAQHSFVRYTQFDVEQSIEAQGFEAGSFDVVIAANVLHATRHLDVTLSHVRSLLTPGGVLIAVEDTGCGIPPEQIDRVFQSFEQVDNHYARANG